ncbi:hypothetical protein [Spirosoma endophyticum]|uniref:Uncharacterized protein n=1 Tax=Spirosoma endophyticum TaxID=662367 RepID=A0A1I1P9N9_9BACT|nr:hypothetical protein [Spirosoma endophyticum]SFD04368.1 hypothetical protein SAMN05216167_10396 [Spirosoma endophyticum]
MTRHTNDLKQQVERILHWEQSSHWRSRDFAHLSELVFTYTNRHVDARDLQLFWTSSSIPSQSVLDSLACYADYADWNDFCSRNYYGEVATDEEITTLRAPIREIPVKWVLVICWFSVLASILVAILLVLNR